MKKIRKFKENSYTGLTPRGDCWGCDLTGEGFLGFVGTVVAVGLILAKVRGKSGVSNFMVIYGNNLLSVWFC